MIPVRVITNEVDGSRTAKHLLADLVDGNEGYSAGWIVQKPVLSRRRFENHQIDEGMLAAEVRQSTAAAAA